MQFAAGLLQLEAGSTILRFKTALLHHGSRHPGDHGLFAKHGAHRQRLVQIAAGRIEINRQAAIGDPRQKFPEAECRTAIDLPFDRDPAVAAAAASVGRALDDIEHHRRRRGSQRSAGRTAAGAAEAEPQVRTRMATRRERRVMGGGEVEAKTGTQSDHRVHQTGCIRFMRLPPRRCNKKGREQPRRAPDAETPDKKHQYTPFFPTLPPDCAARIPCYTAASRLPALVRRSEH